MGRASYLPKIPPHIKFGKKDYCVHFVGELHEAFSGMCYMDQKVILVSTDQTKKQIMAAFFHEALHAIEREYGLELGHPKIKKLEWAMVQLYEQLLKAQK